MRWWVIHGWNEPSLGEKSLGGLARGLEVLGHSVVRTDDGRLPSYGRVLFKSETRLKNRDVGKVWSLWVEPGDGMIAHSNGYQLVREITAHLPEGLEIPFVFALNPAADPELLPSRNVRELWIFAGRKDRAVAFARWIPWSSWGDMGRQGYVKSPGDPAGAPARPRVHVRFHGDGHSPYKHDAMAWASAIDAVVKGGEPVLPL